MLCQQAIRGRDKILYELKSIEGFQFPSFDCADNDPTFLVHWNDNTYSWVPLKNLVHCDKAIEDFFANQRQLMKQFYDYPEITDATYNYYLKIRNQHPEYDHDQGTYMEEYDFIENFEFYNSLIY